MQYEIRCNPSFSILEVALQPGDQLTTEAGAMAWMSPNLKVTTSTRGGMMAGLKRKLLSGESFFQNTYEAQGEAGSIGVAPGAAGDIVAYDLSQGELLLGFISVSSSTGGQVYS